MASAALDDGSALARTVARRCLRAEGVAGVDPRSRLRTAGRRGGVRGVWVIADSDDPGGVQIAVELVGLIGARLAEAGDQVRAEVAHACRDHGVRLAGVEVHFTRLASRPLPAPAAEGPAVLPPLPDP